VPDRNPPWQRDELILALDLYFRHRPDRISKTHPEVVALSKLLNALPLHSDRPDRERFRNANGTYIKLCNFLALDPDYHGKGLERGGRLDRLGIPGDAPSNSTNSAKHSGPGDDIFIDP
jgi:5-methylcytosine-specific restriction protein A